MVEIAEDMCDALYDYEEQLENAGKTLKSSMAENFEDNIIVFTGNPNL